MIAWNPLFVKGFSRKIKRKVISQWQKFISTFKITFLFYNFYPLAFPKRFSSDKIPSQYIYRSCSVYQFYATLSIQTFQIVVFCYFCTKTCRKIINFDEVSFCSSRRSSVADEKSTWCFKKTVLESRMILKRHWWCRSNHFRFAEVISHRWLYFFQREGITGWKFP